MNEIKEYTEKTFEDIKHIEENGNEYWYARELMPLLEYSKWENFNNVIQKAVVSYKNSNNDDMYWLPEIRKPIITGKGKEEFIDSINPKYSIISVGKNNRYGHPNKEVVENLNDSKIYRTDYDGSIMFKIKNDKLQIETCPP